MFAGFDGNVLLDGVALAALTTYIISLLKPFIEMLPFARPYASTHDATLRVLNVVLNGVAVVGLQYQAGHFDPNNWLAYAVVALGQAIGSQGLYAVVTSTSSAAKAQKDATLLAQPAAQPIGQPRLRAVSHKVRW